MGWVCSSEQGVTLANFNHSSLNEKTCELECLLLTDWGERDVGGQRHNKSLCRVNQQEGAAAERSPTMMHVLTALRFPLRSLILELLEY